MSGQNWFDKDTLTQERPRGLTDGERHRAVRFVASNAQNADDAARLLEMLGLDPAEGKENEEAA
ncbi:hypothetical protein [Saccharopolyspora sp. NPDC002376]